MPVKSAAQQHLDKIGDLLARLQKRAKEESDPGGYDGDTSHATKDTENSTVDVDEGSRSRENEQDIKHDQPAGVDSAAEGTPGGQDAAQLNIGTQQSGPDDGDAGNIPTVEDKLPDPGGYEGDTTHPADLDNPAVGEKYGAARQLRRSISQVKEAGTTLLAKIVMASGQPQAKRAEDSVLPAETVTGSDDAKPDSASLTGGGGGEEKKDDSKEAGAKAAEQAMKQAQYQAVVDGIADTIKSACDNATIAADYLDGFFAQAGKGAGDDDDSGEGGSDDSKKKEEGGSGEGKSDSDSGSSGGGESSGPPSAGGGEPDGDEGGDADLMSLLQGGDGGGDAGGMPSTDIGGADAASAMLGAPAGGDAGGAPPMGGGTPPMGGGAPPMGGGAPPMAGGAGGMMPGAGGDQQLAMLAEALAQAGITPEQLQAASAGKMAALLPPKGVKKGSWAPRTAKEAEQFKRMQEVVSELVS